MNNKKWFDSEPAPGKPIMVTIKNNKNSEENTKSIEKALRQFRKKMKAANLFKVIRDNQHFEKPSDKKRRVRKENNLKRKYGNIV